MLCVNILIILKVQFSVIYDVLLTVNVINWSEKTKLCVAGAKLHYFFKAGKTIPPVTVY